MDRYYYVIAQLPMLSFDKPSPMTIEHFLDETKKWLSSRDYSILSAIELDETDNSRRGSATLRMVRQFEYHFRRDLALWRQSQKKDGEYKPETFNLSLVQEGNPLEIEKKILRWRWDYIDSIEKDHQAEMINYGAFYKEHPPQYEVELVDMNIADATQSRGGIHQA